MNIIMNFSLIYLASKLIINRVYAGVFPGRPTTISRAIPSHNVSWTYIYNNSSEDFANWSEDYPKCNGTHQSPVNIDTRKVAKTDMDLEFYGFNRITYNAFIENNGHTVHLGLNGGEKPTINGSAVGNNVYIFEQLHFHWGNSSDKGSEHSVDSVFYPMEMHMVFFNRKYGYFDNSLTQADGLVVIAVFFKHSLDENQSLMTLIRSLRKVPIFGDITELPELELKQLLPKRTEYFYRYRGSLTTPPCSEVVTWIILAQPVNIGPQQEDAFRHERTNTISPETGDFSYLTENYRPQVPLNDRIVESSFRSVWRNPTRSKIRFMVAFS